MQPKPDDSGIREFSMAYALSFVSRFVKGDKRDRVAAKLIGELLGAQRRAGGFGYEQETGGTAFNTAVVILALLDAKERGIKVDSAAEALRRAVRALEQSRTPEGFFPYYIRPSTLGKDHRTATPEGAAARSVPCQYALERYYALFGGRPREDAGRLGKVLANYLRHHKTLSDKARASEGQSSPHTGASGISDYYYLFSAYYMKRMVKTIRSPALEPAGAALDDDLLDWQSEEGFWLEDMFGPDYGTAMALLILLDS